MDKRTIRVLSIDGGGERGYLPLKWLQKFVNKWDIPSNELWKYFNVIGGTSIGGIISLALAYGKSIEELEDFFLVLGKRIFTIRSTFDVSTGSHNASSDSNRPNTFQKVALVVKNSPFYESAYGDSNYGSNILNKALVDLFGNATLSDLKTKVVIPVYEADSNKYVLFSNCDNDLVTGKNHRIVDVARATSAAPVYLPEYKFDNHTYWDGGIFQNNPTQTIINIAKSMKIRSSRTCVLSLGTGIGEMGFDTKSVKNIAHGLTGPLDTVSRVFSLFDIASTGGQEGVDFAMKLLAQNTLEQLYYYRLQPKLDENMDTELDNSDIDFLNYLANIATIEFEKDIINIDNFLEHLKL